MQIFLDGEIRSESVEAELISYFMRGDSALAFSWLPYCCRAIRICAGCSVAYYIDSIGMKGKGLELYNKIVRFQAGAFIAGCGLMRR